MPSDIDIVVNLMTSRGLEGQMAKRPINLCLVIDRSGSMDGNKLEQAKRACLDIFRSLTPDDHFTVLAFDNEVISVVNPQTPEAEVEDRIRALDAGGSTNLSKGWYLGLLELQTYGTPKHINRMILLSDGMANAGERKSAVLGQESARARDELGITTSTIGIGKDFQEDILAALATESGGRWWYIGNQAIADIIREEFSGALSVVMERPAVELQLPQGLVVQQEFNDLAKTGGRYRLRPIKANDAFAFALRLRSDPTALLPEMGIVATLSDGAQQVASAQLELRLGTVQEYADSVEDPAVAMVVSKYLADKADERIVEELDAKNVTTMISMLESQSQLLRDLETKLAGARAMTWEERTELEQEREREMREQELERAVHALQQNDALMAVAQLLQILQGLGAMDGASRLVSLTGMLGSFRKEHVQRMSRNAAWHRAASDYFLDDESLRDLLSAAREVCLESRQAYPAAAAEIDDIRGDIDERLARLS
ncbi:vWA domain-containing protein [Micromonospora sp. WMMC250]|uniref:vWA domain-containing protein n=1 Tax=Micromonospora sp. WMMC250 TaxID=3014781 RepID=UPI0022B72D05|nr:VWA domain-containing protein [Micromonospora sp. WMMC250]MCZ7377095.1 VWA domain-containing protein [Micromonospora sp. WMMC250]